MSRAAMDDDPAREAILEPDLPIVDAHHHLWLRPEAMLQAVEQDGSITASTLAPVFRRHARYLLDEYLADVATGHDVRASVYVEVHTMYRGDGPEALRCVGEVEFANGVAAMAASGLFGATKVCAGIVGGADLGLGDAVAPVLEAQIRAGGGRLRGVRDQHVVYDPDPAIMGAFGGQAHVMADPKFRAGFARLAPLGLSYEAWQLEYQLPELVDLLRAFPETAVVVNHLGGLFGRGRYEGQGEARFAAWRENIRALAALPNVAMKLGGLGMPMGGFPSSYAGGPASSQVLAQEWRPFVETAIEAFGAERCMFESNFPVDAGAASYPVIWNAFKRLAAGASAEEKAALFSGSAQRFYRLDL
jgi:predicted TIM-barrel fold metal-dependent hydrolase